MIPELEINLLPPAKKTGLRSLVKFLYIKEYLELIVVTICLLALMHLGAWFMLNRMVTDLSNNAWLVNRDFGPINKTIQRINARTKMIIVAGEKQYPADPLVAAVAAVLPPTVRLTDMVIDRTSGTVTVTGLASTRDALLDFEKSLATIALVHFAKIPDSQLLVKDSIPFEISGTLADGKLPPDPQPRATPAVTPAD